MIFKLPYKDNKLQWKKQERFGYFSPTNSTDVHGFFRFSISQILRLSDLNKERRIKFSLRRIVIRLYIFIVDNVR